MTVVEAEYNLVAFVGEICGLLELQNVSNLVEAVVGEKTSVEAAVVGCKAQKNRHSSCTMP